MSQQETPTKKCHNCRRQRLRCDRSYPHCNKCILAGKECLGYGQLFRWTGAVASRGKLAGKTSSAPALDVPRPSPNCGFELFGSTPATPGHCSSEPLSDIQDVDETVEGNMQVVRSYQPSLALVDPLFQDLSYPYRHYLSYFANRVCQDLVAYDIPERNPFRFLVPLTDANPLLQHIVVAAAAAHMSNVLCASTPPVAQPGGVIFHSYGGEGSRRALQDALIAKHKALRLMHTAIQNSDSVGMDTILAAALFFVNVELIESGKHGWKAHLEGVGRIMSLLPPDYGPTQDLRDYLLSDCFSYFIFASTFSPTLVTVQSYFESSRIPTVLGRATANSYVCSAPEILEILYAASQLSNVEIVDENCTAEVLAEGLELLSRAQNFDIRAWAIDALSVSYLKDIPLSSRINVGSAHRLAACVYIAQAVSPVGDFVGNEATVLMHQDLRDQLKKIPPEDSNFKATSWSTFIAGAGATTPEDRQWAMDRLQKLVSCCPWGFFYTAMETLQILWNLDASETEGRSWVQTLKDPELNFLIV